MTFDPQLQQAAETSHFKLDEQGFIEGSLVDFLNLGFEKNKAIILSDPRHDLSSGLFQALADPKVMKLLSDKHVKFTAEIPEDYQDYLNAYKKSGDIKDLGDKIPSQMLPFLEAARKYGIDVVAIDLKSTERPMADRFYQVKDEFKLDQKMAAASNDIERASIMQEFMTKYPAEKFAFQKERLVTSSERQAHNISKIIADGSLVLDYSGESHVDNEIVQGLNENEKEDLDELVAKNGYPTLAVSTVYNQKDVITSIMKVDNTNYQSAMADNGRDRPEFLLGFPGKEIGAFLQQDKHETTTYEQKLQLRDKLYDCLGVITQITNGYLQPLTTDTPDIATKKTKAREACIKAYDHITHGDFENANSALDGLKKQGDLKGITHPSEPNTDLDSIFDGIMGILKDREQKIEAVTTTASTSMQNNKATLQSVSEDHKITAPSALVAKNTAPANLIS